VSYETSASYVEAQASLGHLDAGAAGKQETGQRWPSAIAGSELVIPVDVLPLFLGFIGILITRPDQNGYGRYKETGRWAFDRRRHVSRMDDWRVGK
jgi:hypothetical protein